MYGDHNEDKSANHLIQREELRIQELTKGKEPVTPWDGKSGLITACDMHDTQGSKQNVSKQHVEEHGGVPGQLIG